MQAQCYLSSAGSHRLGQSERIDVLQANILRIQTKRPAKIAGMFRQILLSFVDLFSVAYPQNHNVSFLQVKYYPVIAYPESICP
jgi:hypothetical protein